MCCPKIFVDKNHDIYNSCFCRLYSYDKKLSTVTNYYQWFANVTQANQNGRISFVPAYSPLVAYNMTSLSPASFLDLFNQFQSDENIWDTFMRYYNMEAVPLLCDAECKRQWLCAIGNPDDTWFVKCMHQK